MPSPVIATRRSIAQVTTGWGILEILSLDIVVTGIGLASPIGLTVDAAFERLLRGESGSGSVPAYELPGLRSPKNQKFLSPSARHLLWAGLQALESSGWRRDTLTADRTGVFTGSGQTGLEPSQMFPGFKVAQTAEGVADWAALGGPPSRLLDPYFPLRSLANSGLALLAMEIGARGPTNNFVQSDSAGVRALEAAMGALEDGACDVAICGAFESLLTPANELNYRREGLVSRVGRLRPFHLQADGVVLVQGAAAFVLERAPDAAGRGATVLARIGHEGDEPDFVVAAGLGVPAVDCAEAAELRGEGTCTAFKGATGYLGAATASVELALAIAALRARVIPAITGLCEPAECAAGVPLLRGEARGLPADRAVSARCLSRTWLGERARVTVVVD